MSELYQLNVITGVIVLLFAVISFLGGMAYAQSKSEKPIVVDIWTDQVRKDSFLEMEKQAFFDNGVGLPVIWIPCYMANPIIGYVTEN